MNEFWLRLCRANEEYMPAPNDQIIMGFGIASVSLAGLMRHRWLLAHTSKGQALVSRFGDKMALRVWCLFCLAGFAFGALLATGWIRPVSW